MIPWWELAIAEIGLPIIGFFIGNRWHWSLGILLAAGGLAWAEWAMYTAAINGWVIKP